MRALTSYLCSASGSVYLATQLSTSLRVAIKQMDLAHQARKDLIMNEIMIMKESHHANVVNFLDSFLLGGDLWVIMEYMEGGALTDVIDNNEMTEPQIASVCLEVSCRSYCTHLLIIVVNILPVQTAKGLNHLHEHNIIHRDIKSDNILLNFYGQVKISK
jgi:serine/threonine protein kinase